MNPKPDVALLYVSTTDQMIQPNVVLPLKLAYSRITRNRELWNIAGEVFSRVRPTKYACKNFDWSLIIFAFSAVRGFVCLIESGFWYGRCQLLYGFQGKEFISNLFNWTMWTLTLKWSGIVTLLHVSIHECRSKDETELSGLIVSLSTDV